MAAGSVIRQIRADLTGDGIPETITLTGDRRQDSSAWTDIRLNIQDGASCLTARITPPEDVGYEPRLWTGPLLSANSRELLLSIDSGGSGGIGYYTVYTYWDGEYRVIFNSERYNAAYGYGVRYRDGFIVEAESLSNSATYLISIAGRDAEYLDALYTSGGVLIKQQTGGVNPLGLLYPADIDGDGIYELVAYQRITGLYNADGLGDFINRLSWNGTDFALTDQTVGIFAARA